MSEQAPVPMVSQLRSQVESILLVIDTPATVADIAAALNAAEVDITAVSYTHLTLPTICSG